MVNLEVREGGVVHAWSGRNHLWLRKVQFKRDGKSVVFNFTRGVPGEGGAMRLTWEKQVTFWFDKATFDKFIEALIVLSESW